MLSVCVYSQPSLYDLPAMETLQQLTSNGKSRLDVEAAGIDESAKTYISLLKEEAESRGGVQRTVLGLFYVRTI